MSSIYIEVGKNDIIKRIHRTPFDPVYGLQASKEELEQTGFFVNDIPEPLMIEGKQSIAKYNPDSKQIYYEYVDIPLSPTERLDMLEAAFNELILNQMEE